MGEAHLSPIIDDFQTMGNAAGDVLLLHYSVLALAAFSEITAVVGIC